MLVTRRKYEQVTIFKKKSRLFTCTPTTSHPHAVAWFKCQKVTNLYFGPSFCIKGARFSRNIQIMCFKHNILMLHNWCMHLISFECNSQEFGWLRLMYLSAKQMLRVTATWDKTSGLMLIFRIHFHIIFCRDTILLWLQLWLYCDHYCWLTS